MATFQLDDSILLDKPSTFCVRGCVVGCLYAFFRGYKLSLVCLRDSCTLPETNSESTWEWMVGIRSLPCWGPAYFQGVLLVLVRVNAQWFSIMRNYGGVIVGLKQLYWSKFIARISSLSPIFSKEPCKPRVHAAAGFQVFGLFILPWLTKGTICLYQMTTSIQKKHQCQRTGFMRWKHRVILAFASENTAISSFTFRMVFRHPETTIIWICCENHLNKFPTLFRPIPSVNKHSNGKSPSWIGNTSSKGGFSIAMLDYRQPTPN